MYRDGYDQCAFLRPRQGPHRYVPDIKVTWDFDNTVTGGEGFHAIHTYKQEAVFTVRASINNECIFTGKITVRSTVIVPEYGDDLIDDRVGASWKGQRQLCDVDYSDRR